MAITRSAAEADPKGPGPKSCPDRGGVEHQLAAFRVV